MIIKGTECYWALLDHAAEHNLSDSTYQKYRKAFNDLWVEIQIQDVKDFFDIHVTDDTEKLVYIECNLKDEDETTWTTVSVNQWGVVEYHVFYAATEGAWVTLSAADALELMLALAAGCCVHG